MNLQLLYTDGLRFTVIMAIFLFSLNLNVLLGQDTQNLDEIIDSVIKDMAMEDIEYLRELEFIDVPRSATISRPLHSSDLSPREFRMHARQLARVFVDVFDGVPIERVFDYDQAREGNKPICEIEDEQYLLKRGGGPCLTTSAWTIKANPNKFFGFRGIREEIDNLVKRSPDLNQSNNCWERINRHVLSCYLSNDTYGFNIFFDEEKPSELQLIIAW